MLLVLLRSDEVEHGWRTLHGEEAPHQTAQCAGTDLRLAGGLQLDALADEGEIEAATYQYHAQYTVEQEAVYSLQGEDRHRGDHDEGEQYQPQPPPR